MAAPAPGFISVFSSPQELGASLAQLVAQRAACCLAGARARFALGLSGGSLVSMLARELPPAAAPAGPDSLKRWTLGFCDERLVPFEHAESTYGLYRVRATVAAGAHVGKAVPAACTRLRGPPGVTQCPLPLTGWELGMVGRVPRVPTWAAFAPPSGWAGGGLEDPLYALVGSQAEGKPWAKGTE